MQKIASKSSKAFQKQSSIQYAKFSTAKEDVEKKSMYPLAFEITQFLALPSPTFVNNILNVFDFKIFKYAIRTEMHFKVHYFTKTQKRLAFTISFP